MQDFRGSHSSGSPATCSSIAREVGAQIAIADILQQLFRNERQHYFASAPIQHPDYSLHRKPHIMFGGRKISLKVPTNAELGEANNDAAPPPPSKAELEEAERRTASDIRWTAAACVVLYLSPFLVDFAQKFV
ncbi:hypothetical protein K505DRAFT_335189 [Melanomma pulvis-pyrius CBS 109.77]|uniref:Uncharacterized protein n=1 Tax=Melanomma pulvis-pyrius CBS 109.77 TaxID=1314802 RepID=A0A6A6XIU3_9PLEO|nr:hypothetical protein K505DRAFT_335189 [Melanomma pulvis-pyrius CBS 109.77]